jgi:EAL domain-containing protein (putative c-di-GMP-specific phosphodiesterase class I)
VIDETRIGLQGAALSPEQRILSLRYVVEKFAETGKIDRGADDIAATFSVMMSETQTRLADMMRTLEKGDFKIAYQPICDLATRKVSHYEALVRFTNPEGTGETVKFIEALGIANVFDLAIATKVLDVIEQTDVHVAFNVSGATIASPASFGMLAAILAKRRRIAPRTLIEITETLAITDLEGAGKAIAALRAMGYRVGLDDFGAGSASINYLHAFQVDFVKFDGAMVVKMGSSPRHDALMTGLVKLCCDLGVTTIAEWIESKDMAGRARDMGFHHGQGKWLGPPLLEIVAPGAKRQGLAASWG